ncbi:uncharacterized protein LOC136032656 [Artemia franciscana]|uniref:uncharacterized protein LOC136032656 n=1 Tax=Artemia franciscana TaxID=6661 RepID=UPI0032DA87E9
MTLLLFTNNLLKIGETENELPASQSHARQENERNWTRKRRKLDETELSSHNSVQRYRKLKKEKRRLASALRNSVSVQQRQKEEIARLRLNRQQLQDALRNVREELDEEINGLFHEIDSESQNFGPIGREITSSKSMEIVTLKLDKSYFQLRLHHCIQDLSAVKALNTIYLDQLTRMNEELSRMWSYQVYQDMHLNAPMESQESTNSTEGTYSNASTSSSEGWINWSHNVQRNA